jgi:hypothetical protein
MYGATGQDRNRVPTSGERLLGEIRSEVVVPTDLDLDVTPSCLDVQLNVVQT